MKTDCRESQFPTTRLPPTSISTPPSAPSTAFHHFKHLLSTSSGRPDYLAHRYRRRRRPQESHSPALAATNVTDIKLASKSTKGSLDSVRGLASLCFFADPIYALVSPFCATTCTQAPLTRQRLERARGGWDGGRRGGEDEGRKGDRVRHVHPPPRLLTHSPAHPLRPDVAWCTLPARVRAPSALVTRAGVYLTLFFFSIPSHPFPRPALIPALSLIVVLSRTPLYNPIPVVESIGSSPRRAGADRCRCRIHTYPVARAAGEVPRDGRLVPALLGICARCTASRAVSPLPTRTALPPHHTRAHPGTGCQVPSVWNLRTRMPLLSPSAMHAGSFLRRHPPRLCADSALLHIPELRPVSSSALPSPYPVRYAAMSLSFLNAIYVLKNSVGFLGSIERTRAELN
ncbi:hypothetical protein C8F04DRAFT_1257865 [Mycena alexandri]|uniref:Uncharacterized protein n=1 Tax=Mycena alexandri TaxID=1745969 RepID=A0AAD6X930_9AGAR|nr:hypothetical protein C8F04DRAFT_1257865 [Mycena alexandri]